MERTSVVFGSVAAVGEPEQKIGRDVKIARHFRNISRCRIALIGFPIADDSEADVEVFGDGRL